MMFQGLPLIISLSWTPPQSQCKPFFNAFYGENLPHRDEEPLAMLVEGMVKVGDMWLNEDQLPQGMRKPPKLKIGSQGRLLDWYHWPSQVPQLTGWVGKPDYHWPNNVLTFQFSTKFGYWENIT